MNGLPTKNFARRSFRGFATTSIRSSAGWKKAYLYQAHPPTKRQVTRVFPRRIPKRLRRLVPAPPGRPAVVGRELEGFHLESNSPISIKSFGLRTVTLKAISSTTTTRSHRTSFLIFWIGRLYLN